MWKITYMNLDLFTEFKIMNGCETMNEAEFRFYREFNGLYVHIFDIEKYSNTKKEVTEDDLLNICITWEKNKDAAVDMLHEFKPVYSREELTVFISKIYSELM